MNEKEKRRVRNNTRILFDILNVLDSGKNTKSSLHYNTKLSYNALIPYLKRLKKCGFIYSRIANEDELRRDKRSKKFIEITDKGRMFLREIEKLDRKYDWILLGERK